MGLAEFIASYASGSFKAFAGEDDPVVDAVALNTIHGPKGLEWPVVFVPYLTDPRFPPQQKDSTTWLVTDHLFDRHRYDGSDADERRLFYTAITRTREWVVISRHSRINKAVSPSPYFLDLERRGLLQSKDSVRPAPIEVGSSVNDILTLSYSQISAFQECGLAFKLRGRLGFRVRLAANLGYGRAVHHVLRTVAERVRSGGSMPTDSEVDQIFASSFFLPTANKPGHIQMKAAARHLVAQYIKSSKT